MARVLDWGWSPRALDRRVGAWGCATAWVLATALFVGLVALAGGPTMSDSNESMLATAAVARAEFRCAYPSANFPSAPPLYPLLSGAAVAAGRLDGPVVDPGQHPVGPGCRAGLSLLTHVSKEGQRRILWTGVSMWLVLLAGFVLLLRAAGRGRSGWECAGVVVLACLPPVIESVVVWFHPNDMLAIGLVEAMLASAITRRWVAAGVLAGLAFTAHQFTLLATLPLVIAAPPRARLRVVAPAVLAVCVVVAISWVLMGIGAVHAAAGQGNTFQGSGTLVDKYTLTGAGLFVVARVLPLVYAALVAVAGRRRAPERLWSPAVLVSMIALCIAARLVFETVLYGYYFAAAAVLLLVLDVTRGRFRLLTFVWFVLVWATFPVTGAPLLHYSSLLAQVIIVGLYIALVAPEFVRACRRTSQPGSVAPGGPTGGAGSMSRTT